MNDSTPIQRRRPGTPALGACAACGIAVSFGLLAAIGLLGPSAAQPPVGPPGALPPWNVAARPSDALVTALLLAALAVGAAAVAAGMAALRRGWRPPPRRLLAAAAVGVCALLAVPSMGSDDHLDYAAYGRIASLGHSPYAQSPGWLARTGDPIGRAVQPNMWRDATSVYGPVATLTERAASELGGTSPRRTASWIAVAGGVAFLATGLVLDRLARGAPGGRARVHLLWSLNPILAWQFVAGAHVDGLGVAFAAAALLPLRRTGVLRGAASGALLAASAATKATFGLVALGAVWASRRSWRTLLGGALGAAAVLVPAYLAWPGALGAAWSRASFVSRGSPWHLLTGPLDQVVPKAESRPVVAAAALLLGIALAVLLARRLPPGRDDDRAARAVLVLALAWLLTSPYQYPWYDALLWPFLALMPASRLDWLVLARTAALSLAYVPGRVVTLSPPALDTAMGVLRGTAVPAVLVALLVLLVGWCVRGTPQHGHEPLAGAGQPRSSAVPSSPSGGEPRSSMAVWKRRWL